MSARVVDGNGFWLVKNNPITKVGIFPYSGAQLGLTGPEADRIYQVLRPEEELSKPEVLASFNLLPLIDGHTMLGEGYTPAERAGVQGTTGDNAHYRDGVVYNDLKIFSSALAKKIEKGITELSCGYRCKYDLTPGNWRGQPYDAVQRFQNGNHLALVPEGRMGSSVAVLDAMIFTTQQEPGRAMIDTAKLLAALEAVTAIVKGEAAEQGANPPAPAGDMDPPPADPAPPVKDAEPATPPAPPAKDMDPPAAGDADPEVPASMDEALRIIAKQRGVIAGLRARPAAAPAMDEKAVIGRLAARDALVRRVTPLIGVFDHAGLTEAEVASYAVKKLKLNAPAGLERATLDGYLQSAAVGATPTTPAADAKPSSLVDRIRSHGVA